MLARAALKRASGFGDSYGAATARERYWAVVTTPLVSLTIFIGSAFIGCIPALAQASSDQDTKAILELGAATNWNVSGGAATFAPNLAVEVEPIENWLELELGVSPFYTHNSQEWDTDLLFKKPWTLSRKLEFMLGVGPQWVHLKQGSNWTNTLVGEVAADFMFWPTGKHRLGWYVEPSYDYSFARGHQKSLGVSLGLIIGLH